MKKNILILILSILLMFSFTEVGIYGGVCPSSPCNAELNESHHLGSGKSGNYVDFFMGLKYNKFITPLMIIPDWYFSNNKELKKDIDIYENRIYFDNFDENKDNIFIDDYNFTKLYLILVFWWFLSLILIFVILKKVFEIPFIKKNRKVIIIILFIILFISLFWSILGFLLGVGEQKWFIWDYWNLKK